MVTTWLDPQTLLHLQFLSFVEDEREVFEQDPPLVTTFLV